MSDWTPPVYKWLLTTRTDNGIHFYDIFDTRAGAMEWADDNRDIPPEEWHEDVSGDLNYLPAQSAYSYFITQEPYHPGGK